MLKRGFNGGVTLIELMVGVAMIALLLALGLPSLNDYMANAKIRASAAAFNAGVQFARAEAIRLNGGVQMVLTDDAPLAANASSATPSATGKNWLVRSLNPGTTDTYTFLDGKSAQEGSQRSNGTTPVAVSGAAATISFNGLGASDLGATSGFDFSNTSGGACAPSGPMRCLRVQVTAGGQVRLCDPAVTTTGDARKCS